jgi:hypothetical protein
MGSQGVRCRCIWIPLQSTSLKPSSDRRCSLMGYSVVVYEPGGTGFQEFFYGVIVYV